jgi:phosphotransferase family enzyme
MSGMATRRRSWPEVPTELRQEAERQLGSPVRDFRGRPGGFTPGLAGIAVCADGTEAFIKATPVDGPGAADYRREAVIAGGLPEGVPAPRLRFAAERDGWLMLCFNVAPGHTAQEPWQPAQLTAILTTLSSCVEQLTPSPIPDVGTVADRMAGRCRTWRSLATRGEIDGVTLEDLGDWERDHLARLASLEDTWQDHVDGTTLLHFDLRADNCLISPAGSVSFVDWGRACTGPAWVDLVCLMLESDLGDIDAEHLFTGHPLGQGADPDAVDGFLVALAGYWALAGRQPPITHAPGLRQQQARSGQATLRWLQRRWAA